MTTCVLIDCCDGVLERQTIVRSADHLRELLGAYAGQEPRILRLEGMAGLLVRIGVGGPVGVVHVSERGSVRDRHLALASAEHTPDAVTFRYLGRPARFAVKYLLPAAAVIDIATYLYRTRELPTWVDWEHLPDPA